MTTLDELASSNYILLTTFRKDGTPVPTPVWCAKDGDALVAWTETNSWKVKRIRRNAVVAVAPCTARGKPLGPDVAGQAEVLDASGTRRVRTLIKRKYWITGRVVVTLSTLRRGEAGTVGVRIVLTG
jgi:PPOX class probable F420-dependent enzyme